MEKITWEAYEYIQPERPASWFMALWIVAAGLVVGALITKSYLLALFILISALVVHIFALKEPNRYTFAIDQESIAIGPKNHNISEFNSFWIFEREDGNVLSLEAKKSILPHIQIPLGETNVESIRETLSSVLKEKEQQESLLDAVAKILKF